MDFHHQDSTTVNGYTIHHYLRDFGHDPVMPRHAYDAAAQTTPQARLPPPTPTIRPDRRPARPAVRPIVRPGSRPSGQDQCASRSGSRHIRPEEGAQVTNDAFDDRDIRLGCHQKQADDFRLRHAAVREEIWQYTWLLVLLVGWPVPFLAAKNLGRQWGYAPYFVFLPILGLCFSVIAFSVVRRELVFYNESDVKLLYIEKAPCLTSHNEFLEQRLRRAARDGFTADGYAREMSHIGTYLPGQARIRALFLLEFIIFATVSIAEILFCVIAFFRTL